MAKALYMFLVGTLLAACSSTSLQRSGEGALTGAAAGAVGSMFAAAIFGGDIGDAAARGAAYGAGAGAVTGAIQGSQEDARRRQREEAAARKQELETLNALRAEIGPDTFSGLEALVDGKQEVALAYARTATRSEEDRYVLAASWLEVLTRDDLGEDVSSQLPRLIELDPKVSNTEVARMTLNDLSEGLAKIRASYK